MTKQKKENAMGPEDCEPKDQGNSDQEGERDPQPTVKPNSDIDDGGPLSI